MTRDEVIQFHHQLGWSIEDDDYLRWLCGVWLNVPSEKMEKWVGIELCRRLRKQYSPLKNALAAKWKYAK